MTASSQPAAPGRYVPLVELLEDRRLLSAAINSPPRVHHPVVDSAVHAHFRHAPSRAKITVPSEIIGDYGGSYFIELSQGNVSMSVTFIKGKKFTGTIEFDGYDGSSTFGTFTATMGKGLNFKYKFKADRTTSFSGTGSYNPQANSPEMTVLVKKGKFQGDKISRFIPGEFAVLQGLNV